MKTKKIILVTAMIAITATTNTNAGTQDAMIQQHAQTKAIEVQATKDTAIKSADTSKFAAVQNAAPEPQPLPQDETPNEPTAWWFTLGGILLGAYELAVRFIPTIGNYSALAWIFKFVEAALPNLKKGGGLHK